MHYPKQLMIGGVPYEVKVIERFISEKTNGDVCTGEINYLKQEILLTELMKFEYGSKVLLHEAIHGILHEYGMDRYNKEDLVIRLTFALHDFIKANDLSFLTGNKVLQENQAPPAEKATADLEPTKRKVDPEKAPDPEAARPRTVSLIGGGGSGGFSLAELATIKEPVKESVEKQEEPEFWTTGIKVKEGVEHYKTYYECACGKKSRRYLSLDEDACECHECGVKIQKEPAIANKPMQRDNFGNYFVAFGIKKY